MSLVDPTAWSFSRRQRGTYRLCRIVMQDGVVHVKTEVSGLTHKQACDLAAALGLPFKKAASDKLINATEMLKDILASEPEGLAEVLATLQSVSLPDHVDD